MGVPMTMIMTAATDIKPGPLFEGQGLMLTVAKTDT